MLIFTKSELKKLILLLVGIVMMGLFEVVGISAIVPFIAVVVSPELVFENPYLLKQQNSTNVHNILGHRVSQLPGVVSYTSCNLTFQCWTYI